MNNPPNACGDQEPFALMVLGNDMLPEFAHETLITVDPSHPIISGVFVVVELPDDTYFRQLIIKDNQQYLVALNDKSTIKVPNNSNIKGVVVQSYRKQVSTHYHYHKADTFTKQIKTRHIQRPTYAS